MTAASQKEKDRFRIQKIGYVFQDFKLLAFPVGENVACSDDYDEESEIIEVECPECGETVCFYDEMMDDEGEYDTVEILCPKCDAVVYTFESELIEDVEDEDIAF